VVHDTLNTIWHVLPFVNRSQLAQARGKLEVAAGSTRRSANAPICIPTAGSTQTSIPKFFAAANLCSQLAEARGKLEVAAAERADLRADLAAVRESKLVADREARSARERSAHLERELAFYQSQSASAMVSHFFTIWSITK